MRHHSGPFLSFLAYYMGAPSDQFLYLLWRPSYVCFFHTIWGPLGSITCILYCDPQNTFFAYYMGPLRSVSSHTIWGPFSDQLHCLLYGGPTQISFFACYRGGGGVSPQILVFSQNIWGPPQISFSAYYMGLPQVSFFVYYMGSPQISFCAYFLGPLSDQFFVLLYGTPSDQFLRIL